MPEDFRVCIGTQLFKIHSLIQIWIIIVELTGKIRPLKGIVLPPNVMNC